MWHQFVCYSLQKWPKMRKMLDSKFDLTPCISSHFPSISKNNSNFSSWPKFLAQSKRMVNNQTSQKEPLNIFFYLSNFGIVQYVREILQFSLPTDHPVVCFQTIFSQQQTFVASFVFICTHKILL